MGQLNADKSIRAQNERLGGLIRQQINKINDGKFDSLLQDLESARIDEKSFLRRVRYCLEQDYPLMERNLSSAQSSIEEDGDTVIGDNNASFESVIVPEIQRPFVQPQRSHRFGQVFTPLGRRYMAGMSHRPPTPPPMQYNHNSGTYEEDRYPEGEMFQSLSDGHYEIQNDPFYFNATGTNSGGGFRLSSPQQVTEVDMNISQVEIMQDREESVYDEDEELFEDDLTLVDEGYVYGSNNCPLSDTEIFIETSGESFVTFSASHQLN